MKPNLREAELTLHRAGRTSLPAARERPSLRIRPTESWPYRVAVGGIFLILAVGALGAAKAVVMPLAAAVLTGFLLSPLQTRLERRGMPPFLAALVLLAGFVVGILLAARLLVIPFQTWSERLPEIWDALRAQLDSVRALVLAVQDAAEAVQKSAGLADTGGVVAGPDLLGNLAVGVPTAAARVALFIGILYFFLASRTRIRAQLLAFCTTRATRLRMGRIIQECESAVSGYLSTITLINIGLGVTTAVALVIVGTPNAGFWGAMAAVLNFIPYIGPGVLCLLLLGVGLVGGSHGLALYLPPLAFLGLHIVESNFVTPSILGARMTVEPLLVIISLGFWLWLWGPVGAFLAVPLLLVIKVVVLRLLR